ncbi:hypothetical protein ACOMHN_050747 [Nucella lapillus]
MKSKARQDAEYAKKERERRQDAEYVNKEREKNQERMTETRQDAEFANKEREKNQERKSKARQDAEFANKEREKNQERKSKARQDAEYANKERERILTRRQDAEYAKKEKEKNQERMTKKKQDADYAKRARFQNRDRKAAVRMQRVNNKPITKSTQETQSSQSSLQVGSPAAEHVQIPVANPCQTHDQSVGLQSDTRVRTHLEIKAEREYRKAIVEGPECVCRSCGNLWFKKSVRLFDKQMFLNRGIAEDFLDKYCGCEGLFHGHTKWICRCHTCHSSIRKGAAPRLSLGRGLDFPDVPAEVARLTPLEERLVSPKIPFMQIRPLGVDRQHGLKGNVVFNVPVEEHGITTLAEDWLQQHPTTEETFIVDHADVLENESAPDLEEIRPEESDIPIQEETVSMEEALQPISAAENQESNSTASETTADANNANGKRTDNDEEKSQPGEDDWDETAGDEPINPGVEGTLLDCGQAIKFAPGEGQRPLAVLMDKDSEELAFLTIYGGHRRVQPEKVSYTDIAKSEARRYDRRATKIPKLFFSYKKMEMVRVSGSIQTCLRKKLQDQNYSARDMLNQETVGNIVGTDQGYYVLRPVRGSPLFWQQKKKELLAMVRQLGCPTFFFTRSAAETRWKELLKVLFKLDIHDDPEPDEIDNLSFTDKAQFIRSDSVTCARYFDHRFRVLFTKIIRSKVGPLGEVTDFFHRVEFQHRGSPHIHSLLWIKDAPKFEAGNQEGGEAVTAFIDQHITCHKPAENESLFEEVLLQQHKHSHTCLKQVGEEKTCRFQITKLPMSQTCILRPLQTEERAPKDGPEKLQKIKDKLNHLSSQANVRLTEFLDDIPEEEYVACIRSTLKREDIFLKREVSEARSNAYNPDILRLWHANMDIQFVLDPYACVMYIINYVGKSQRGMSTLLRSAIADVRKGNNTVREKLRAVSNCFVNSSDISAQEACYYLLRMPVSQASCSCVFINTNRPEKRIHMLKLEEVLRAMDPDSTDIMRSGLLDKYLARPNEMENVCLAEFAANYNINSTDPCISKPHDDEDEEDREGNTEKTVTLLNGKGFVTQRKWAKVIRYCNFSILKDMKEHYREQLMLLHPWRDEQQDLIDVDHERKFKEHEQMIDEK